MEGCQKEVWKALKDCNVSEAETNAMIKACDDLSPQEQETIGKAAIAYVQSNCVNPSGNQCVSESEFN